MATSAELEQLSANKESGYNFRERRQNDWKENYTLYRDKVSINRLTQRQSVNLPLMKQTIRTLLKDVDDMPVLYFENLDNDKQAETFQNEYWKWVTEDNHMDLKDIMDKRQVFLYGRSFDQMQIIDGKVKIEIVDPEDILIDRYVDPSDLNTARFLIHTHIFKPLTVIEANTAYDQAAVKELKKYYATKQGLIKAGENGDMDTRKKEKMRDMGLVDVEEPVLGETIVELSLHFMYHKEPGDAKEQLYLYVEAEDQVILLKEKLETIIGTTETHYWRNNFPYGSWGDDLDKQDFWSDGIADIVRTPNKVLNSWFSQLVENRTLRNFGMHYYDSTIDGFTPQTFEPIPWGWYGVPGKPQDMIQKVDIPDLSESLDEMQFVITMLEKSTGATSTQQGAESQKQITLGEVQLALSQAKERIKGMSKFYTPAWKNRGLRFLMMIEAASNKLDAVKIYKKGRNTSNIYTREIAPKDWMTKSGYTTRIWSQDEKNTEDTQSIQKLTAAKTIMPDNPKLQEIFQMKLLEFSNLTPEQVTDIMDFERKKAEALMQMNSASPPAVGGLQPGAAQPPQTVPPAAASNPNMVKSMQPKVNPVQQVNQMITPK